MARRASQKREAPASSPPSRQSKRIKSYENTPTGSQTGGRKSKYFEGDDSEEEDSVGVEESDFEEDDDPTADEEDEEDAALKSESSDFDEDDEEAQAPKGRRKSGNTRGKSKAQGKKITNATIRTKTGHGSGVEVVTKLPKPRGPGSTPYEDDTIHPNTFLFLKDLKKNNDRDWLKSHDPDYRTSLNDFNAFVGSLTSKVVEKDDSIPELPFKDLVFRIYRDVRFSKNKIPYKTYFSAAWSRTGRKGPYAFYYLQAEPGKSFLGGGIYHPEAQYVHRMRAALSRDLGPFIEILSEANFRREFLKGVPKDEKKIVKAFMDKNSGDALKKGPKIDYDMRKHDELLRLRSFTVGANLTDSEMVGPGSLERIANLVGWMKPMITYINSIIMPDEEEESDQPEGSDAASASDESEEGSGEGSGDGDSEQNDD